MKRKGFTLIELLAVIVILAIIAFIAVPMILGVVERARKSAAESSAAGYLDAVEKQMMVNELDEDTTNDIPDGTLTVATLNSTYKVKVKGTKPKDDGTVTVENKKIVSATLSVNGYDITCTSEKCSVQGSNKTKQIKNIVLSEDAEIEEDESHIFTATIEPSDADISSIKWCSSSDTIISGTTEQGRCETGEYEITACYGNTSCEVTGASEGNTSIISRVNNVSDSVTLTIEKTLPYFYDGVDKGLNISYQIYPTSATIPSFSKETTIKGHVDTDSTGLLELLFLNPIPMGATKLNIHFVSVSIPSSAWGIGLHAYVRDSWSTTGRNDDGNNIAVFHLYGSTGGSSAVSSYANDETKTIELQSDYLGKYMYLHFQAYASSDFEIDRIWYE